MKKTLFYSFAGALLLLSVSGCAYKEIERNQDNLAKIRKGMTKEQVIAIMGEPIKGESYCRDDVFFYYTRQVWMDGLVTRDECTPIAFDYFGKVIGWGRDFNTGVYKFIPEKK